MHKKQKSPRIPLQDSSIRIRPTRQSNQANESKSTPNPQSVVSRLQSANLHLSVFWVIQDGVLLTESILLSSSLGPSAHECIHSVDTRLLIELYCPEWKIGCDICGARGEHCCPLVSILLLLASPPSPPLLPFKTSPISNAHSSSVKETNSPISINPPLPSRRLHLRHPLLR
ncbi:hypothetical protein ACMFMG_004200 [Clarireedia jacksonii]